MKIFRKYWAFARIAARQQLSERGELYGRALFFAVILGVFSSLWRAVGEAVSPFSSNADSLVWYLAATEWVLLSAPQLHADVAEDVRRGDIAAQLPRPVSYLFATLARGLGKLVVRAPLLGLAAFACAFAFTGTVPSARALAFTIPFAVCASALLMACFVLLGLFAFWLTDISPLYWVWQKLLFVLGGLMLPLSFYPDWLQTLAAFTPFPTLLGLPAGFLLEGSATDSVALSLRLLGWTLLVVLASAYLFGRAVRSLRISGG